MASRIIHLAVARRLSEQYPELNTDRFFLGSMLPDACQDRTAHFILYVDGGARKTHDLRRFRALYGARLPGDGLYLGYYLHLIQDILFRKLMYEELNYDPRAEGNVARLHLDYQLTNRAVIERYRLVMPGAAVDGLRREPLLQAFGFDLEAFRKELERDFRNVPEGRTVFFTEQIAELFLDRAFEVCRKELQALRSGEGCFDELENAWLRRDTI